MAAQGRTHVCTSWPSSADRAVACAALGVAVAAAGCASRAALLGVRGRRLRVRRQRLRQRCVLSGRWAVGVAFMPSRLGCVAADAVFVTLRALRCVHRLARSGREGRWRQRRGASSAQERRAPADVTAPAWLLGRRGRRRRMRHGRRRRRRCRRSGDGGIALALRAASSHGPHEALQRIWRRVVGRRGPRLQRAAPVRHRSKVRRARCVRDERAAAAAGGAKQRSVRKQRQQRWEAHRGAMRRAPHAPRQQPCPPAGAASGEGARCAADVATSAATMRGSFSRAWSLKRLYRRRVRAA